MLSLHALFLLLALLCFFSAAFGINQSRVNVLALGLAFWMIALLVGTR